jgi:hypothetical protein
LKELNNVSNAVVPEIHPNRAFQNLLPEGEHRRRLGVQVSVLDDAPGHMDKHATVSCGVECTWNGLCGGNYRKIHWGANVNRVQEQLVQNVRPALLVLLGAVAFPA